jgi:mannan endo-1,6-alpha-mannosidase
MSALSVVQSLLINEAPALVTNSSGGTSQGNAAAGSKTDGGVMTVSVITGKDRAGAGILTAIMVCSVLAGVGFMVTGS